MGPPVSAFHYLKSGGMNEGDRAFSQKELSSYNDFGDFVRGWLNEFNVWKWYHFQPQWHFITQSHGKVKMDFIGRFERIDEDLAIVSRQLGVPAGLTKTNSSRHAGYRSLYDSETRKIVGRVYARDIEQLGYEF